MAYMDLISSDYSYDFVSTVPDKPTLQCIVEKEAITIDITKGAGKVDKFSLTCTNCNDTSRHEDEIHQHRYTNLVPYTTYTFKATAIAGPNYRKESAETEMSCKANEGRKYPCSMCHCIDQYGVHVVKNIDVYAYFIHINSNL